MYIILQADLQAGIFYCTTGFLVSFYILKKMQQNDGVLWTHPLRIFLERYFRLTPLYFFMMLFLTKFVSLFGGRGPMFYQFETSHSCRETWFWHVTMFNNIFPWAENDYCIK
mmetsp:Transcript_14995/g.23221  ORF Transcript_14995/g.23221 Transcript_14995/m.23221 type:complete len:112 (+) Transcript_14995:914-1249(+)